MFTLCANSHNSSGTFFRLDMQTWMVFGIQDDIPKEFWSCQRFWKAMAGMPHHQCTTKKCVHFCRSRWWQETGEMQDKSQQNEEMGLGAMAGWLSPELGTSDLVIGFTPPWNDVLVWYGGRGINLVIHFGSHIFDWSTWCEFPWFLVMDFGGWGWLDDWVDEWKICWEIVAVRMWSVTSWFSCGPSLLAHCYQKHPTAVLVHLGRYSQSLVLSFTVSISMHP